MAGLILHHYPASSYSEKIRAILGYKNLSWQSVEAPDIMPKPVLAALTGGYRLVPVLQNGADLFCGSDCVAEELQRLHPSPPLGGPQDQTIHHAFTNWGEAIFTPLVTVALASDIFSDAFVKDRQVMSGPGFNPVSAKKYLEWRSIQAKAQFQRLEAHLSDGRRFLCGDTPGMGDFGAYHPVWSLADLKLTTLLEPFPNLIAWRDRIAAFGHGTKLESNGETAIGEASAAEPASLTGGIHHPLIGTKVKVHHDGYNGGQVSGALCFMDETKIAIDYENQQVGRVRIWFAISDCVVTRAKG